MEPVLGFLDPLHGHTDLPILSQCAASGPNDLAGPGVSLRCDIPCLDLPPQRVIGGFRQEIPHSLEGGMDDGNRTNAEAHGGSPVWKDLRREKTL